MPLPFAEEPAATTALTLLGVADPLGESGDIQVTGSIAQRSDQGLNPVPKLGYAGAAAIDAQGRFAGMVDHEGTRRCRRRARRRSPAWCRPPPCGLFFKLKGSPSAAGHGATAQSVLRVICVRK